MQTNEQQNYTVTEERKLMAKDGLKQFIRMIWSDVDALLLNANLDFQLFGLTPDMSIVQFKQLASH